MKLPRHDEREGERATKKETETGTDRHIHIQTDR